MVNIHPKIHGILDYIIGLLFIFLPTLFKWEIISIPSLVFEISGLTILLYSLITKYDLGILNVISIQKHLLIDCCLGFFIILSPFIFGFYDESYKYHLISGFLLMLLVGFSTTDSPSTHSGQYFSTTDKRHY